MSCDMRKHLSQLRSHQSFLGVLKVPLASELTIKRKLLCDPALVGQNVHSGHVHVSLAFCQLFFKNNGYLSLE